MDDLIRLLPGIIRAAGDAEEVAEAAAAAAWRRVAGEGLRSHAVPFRLYRKTLVVSVADRTWQRQLEAMSGQLLFRLNSVLGQAVVTFIEFRIDPATVKQARRGEPGNEGLLERAEREERALRCAADAVGAAADGIRDEHLRRRFLLAAGSYIERRERED